MSYFQKHKRIAQEVEATQSHSRNTHSRTLTQDPPKTRKPVIGTSRIADSRTDDDAKHAKTKEKDTKSHTSDTNRINYVSAQESIPHPRRQLPPPPQNPSLSKIETMMNEADNSMQQLLNSSINQFSKYLERQPTEEHMQLVAQNQHLRTSLSQLKNILKEKLESALRKQKLEVTAMMDDYVKLITKLLKDKEELTLSLEQTQQETHQLQEENNQLTAQTHQLETETHALHGRLQSITIEKDAHIAKTKSQIDDFLQIIEQYEEESQQESKEHEAMKTRIHELETQLRQQQQSPKLQTLIELLQRSEEEKRQILEENGWEQRQRQLERQHEQEFIEYERAMRETINKKDECIERLNLMIESLKQRKHIRENSFETTSDLPFN